MNGERLSHILHADHCVRISHSARETQTMFRELERVLHGVGLTLNGAETKERTTGENGKQVVVGG